MGRNTKASTKRTKTPKVILSRFVVVNSPLERFWVTTEPRDKDRKQTGYCGPAGAGTSLSRPEQAPSRGWIPGAHS